MNIGLFVSALCGSSVAAVSLVSSSTPISFKGTCRAVAISERAGLICFLGVKFWVEFYHRENCLLHKGGGRVKLFKFLSPVRDPFPAC